MMGMKLDRGIDLNLNCSPCSSDDGNNNNNNNNSSVKEEIREAIIHHEITFREQVRELHRLYWTQKHMMHELLLFRESNLLNPQLNPSLPVRDVQWSLGEGTSGVIKRPRNVVIDLEKPIDLDSDEEEEDEIICLSDSPEMRNNRGKDDNNNNNNNKVGRFWDGSNDDDDDDDDASLRDDELNSRAGTQFDFESSAQEHNTSIRLPPDKEENTTSKRPFQIDLNITIQSEDPQNEATISCLHDTGKRSDSVNGSSKGSSITLLANNTTNTSAVSATENPKKPSFSDEGRQEQEQEQDLNVVKDKKVTNLNASDVIGSEDDTVSSHIITTGNTEIHTDITVATAAETLVSFHSRKKKLESFVYKETISTSEQCTSDEEDSFVVATLGLQEETADDAIYIPPNNNLNNNLNNGSTKSTRTINLRRGRGLRDFQRDVLPGMITLSRNEICEDLQVIGYEVRKTRSRRSFDPDEWARPGRGRKGRRGGRRR